VTHVNLTADPGIVVVGYDGSEESDLALQEGKRIARARGARLRLVAVLSPGAASPGRDAYVPVQRAYFLSCLERAEITCEREVSVQTALVEGEPAEVLVREAADASIVVIGSRGHRAIRPTPLLGVAWALTSAAPCPVIVVSRGPRGEVNGSPAMGLAP
jgi:nucleotide-binding universal stress UspA family protein